MGNNTDNLSILDNSMNNKIEIEPGKAGCYLNCFTVCYSSLVAQFTPYDLLIVGQFS